MIKINLTCKVIQMTKLSSDIISCSVCNDEKERFLFNPNTNLCVNCWLKGEDLPNKNVEEKVNEYMNSTDQLFR